MKNEQVTQQEIQNLKETVERLEKELENCLSPGVALMKFTTSRDAFEMVINICAGLFEKGAVDEDRYYDWSIVPHVLLSESKFERYFTDAAFKRAFSYLISALHNLWTTVGNEEKKTSRFRETAEILIVANENDLQGLRLLKAAIMDFYELDQTKWDLEKQQIDYLCFSMDILIYCSNVYLASRKDEE